MLKERLWVRKALFYFSLIWSGLEKKERLSDKNLIKVLGCENCSFFVYPAWV